MKNQSISTIQTIPQDGKNVNSKSAFYTLIYAYETAYITGNDYSTQLLELSRAIAYSVIAKVYDPQRKAAALKETVSNSGLNPTFLELKRGLYRGSKELDAIDLYLRDILDVDVDIDGIIGNTLSDGIDLAQEAACELLAQSEKYLFKVGDITKPFTVKQLSKRVLIKQADSAAYRTIETTPIQEVFKAVRRAIANSKAMQTDPRNGYSYIEETVTDSETGALETVYRRLGKYADLGGNVCNSRDYSTAGAPSSIGNSNSGLYTTDQQTVIDYEEVVKRLKLTDRQATVLKLRVEGKGYKAIGTYLGITQNAVYNTVKSIQDRWNKMQ